MKKGFTIGLLLMAFSVKAQKVDSIYFNLYTDSLKKGMYNYINVDGKFKNGGYTPLMENEVIFKSTEGRWDGNSLILDTSLKIEKITITATLKSDPAVSKSIVVYLKKVNTDPILKSEKEVMEEYKRKKKG